MEEYAIIGDCSAAALVGLNGSIDWLCWPRFDSPACFAALLGAADHGRWAIGPASINTHSRRAYLENTLVLETVFSTPEGSFALIDFMAVNAKSSTLIRIVEGRQGRVPVEMNLTLRFDYGCSVPWVSKLADSTGNVAIAGPNLTVLRTTAPLQGEDLSTTSSFAVDEGERVAFTMSYGLSHKAPPDAVDSNAELEATVAFWQTWAARCTYRGDHHETVLRSLLTLKAMTFVETGAIVAAPTTSLPEQLGGSRNWDYRYCWIRDATLTLTALMGCGYYDEAAAWRDWLHRALAGTPQDLQIMYGIFGERRLAEWEVPWLPGYQGAAPVRVGNAASDQLQLDVYGEMMDALHLAREGGLNSSMPDWQVQCQALLHLENIWMQPDDGIWEVRGGRQQFTHSKVMAWVAFDRSIKDAEKYGLDAPLERWRKLRDLIHKTILEQGFHPKKQSFTQSFGGAELDASLLLLPQVGFLPIEDHRIAGTVSAIERELLVNGFVMRYRSESGADGLPPGEGVFIPCSFWLVDVYQRQGRHSDARRLLDRLLALRNDVGLLSEEYDCDARRLVGNFPQAFSHLSLVQTVLGAHTQIPLRDQI
ncbi:MAG: glycoside hydrolase family 15 protein, partial [Pseudomonadota bacterium]|nr:glycoside hydrolase family 15 protein [Pseudomonadota bacterium]